MDALNTCSDCHSSDATIVAVEQQFDAGPHAFGEFPVYDRGSCNSCHSHNGFVAANTDAELDEGTGFASMNCRTCHDIHMDTDGDGLIEAEEGFALTTTDPVKLLVADATEPYLDSVVDFSFDGAAHAGSNLCAACHKARSEDSWPDWEAPLTQMFELGEHYDLHHGPQANVFVAEFPTSVEFGEATTDAFSPHKAASCVGCHMGFGVEGGAIDTNVDPAPTPTGELHHTFEPGIEVCEACHGAGFDADLEAFQDAVMADLQDLGNCLDAVGVIHEWDPAEFSWEPVFDDYLTETPEVNEGMHPEPYVAAYVVFSGLVEDGSWGVHQPRYANDMAAAALDYMTTQVPGCDADPVL
jgi:hypothetical protein